MILVVIDTLRRDHLPMYGYPRRTSPNLARLAAEGSFADAISPTSWTKPAVATLLTALHPLRHQTLGNLDVLPEGARTAAEILKEGGYQTLGVTANGFVGNRFGFAQGFDAYLTLPETGLGQFEPAATVNRVLETRLPPLRAPFFLYLHYLDPHAPYEPMGTLAALELTHRLPRPTPVGILDLEMENFMSRPKDQLNDARDQYDGEIRRVDDAIGEVLAHVRRQGLLDTTLVVVTSDHGEEMQEHGRMGHGQSLYEEVVRVPLIFWGPGAVAPGVHHGTVSIEDVLPTALDLMGLPMARADVDGEDLAPAITAGRRIDGSEREMLLHLDAPGGHYLALRTDRRKLVLGQGPYRKELFALDTDPREQESLLASEDGRGEFRAMAPRLAARYRTELRRALQPTQGPDNRELHEALAALGYAAAVGDPRSRYIPSGIVAPDPDQGGLLGWEDLASFESCVDLTAPAASQLLLGWYPHEKDGRWMWPNATAAFRLVAGSRMRLEVTGRNPASRPTRVRLLWDGHRVLDTPVDPGPFHLAAPLGAERPAGVHLLGMEASPSSQLPPRKGQRGRREVGLFVRSLCVRPDRGAPAAVASRQLPSAR